MKKLLNKNIVLRGFIKNLQINQNRININNLIVIFLLFVFWRIFLLVPLFFSRNLNIIHWAYIAPMPLANFDGIHYLSIARNGYAQFEQAFFPLFPLLINIFNNIFKVDYLVSGIIISQIALVLSLYFMWQLVKIDFGKKVAFLSLLFLLFFPTSFFLGNIYSESLFTFLVLSSFYYARKGNFLISSILGAFASATRVVGIFIFPAILLEAFFFNRFSKNTGKRSNLRLFLYPLIIPFGLILYMYYLFIKFSDPLMFVHSQAAFTGRTGGQIILLPQVIWRYIKILTTVSVLNYDYWISFLELLFFTLSLFIVYLCYKKGFRKSYILFSSCALLFPTLSGTLLSMPRFIIASFITFIYFATIKNKIIRYSLLAIGILLEGLLAALFYRGYFIS